MSSRYDMNPFTYEQQALESERLSNLALRIARLQRARPTAVQRTGAQVAGPIAVPHDGFPTITTLASLPALHVTAESFVYLVAQLTWSADTASSPQGFFHIDSTGPGHVTGDAQLNPFFAPASGVAYRIALPSGRQTGTRTAGSAFVARPTAEGDTVYTLGLHTILGVPGTTTVTDVDLRAFVVT